MIQAFDLYNQPERPYIVLCNPNRKQLYSLDMIYNDKLDLRYNALSEFSFTIPEYVDGKLNPAYAYTVSKRLVLIENVGYFIIENPKEDFSGNTNIKNIICKSLENELNNKKVIGLKGTFVLYNPAAPAGTLLDKIVRLTPGWKIGTVDSSVGVKSRTFNVSEATIYSFLMNDCASAYDCIFTFDTINKKINVLSKTSATTNTDIYLSFENLVKHVEINTISEEIVTAMHVYGAGDLSINSVNPLGSNVIYDFSYYKSTDWVSQELLTAINAWETKISNNQTAYANKLTQIKNVNAELLSLETQVEDLRGEYSALEGVLKVRVETGGETKTITDQMTNKMYEIQAVLIQIGTKRQTLTTYKNELININNQLKLEANFTTAQVAELDSFIVENTYQNVNFVQTDLMTPVQIQDEAQALYNQGKEVLARVAVPRYEFSIDSINFLWLKEYTQFINQLVLGAKVTIDLDKYTVTAVLLEISMSYNDPTAFKLTFSNRLRLDRGEFIYSDLFGEVVKTGATVNFESDKWNEFGDNYKDEVSEFINGVLDASKNEVINAANQEIRLGEFGLRGRKSTGTDTYGKEEVWLTSNTLAFTKDNWQTASLALGKLANGTYGLVGDVIVGRILSGNNLTIESEKKDGGIAVFKVDGTGVKIHNSTFDISTTKNQIKLNPTDGIRIQAKDGSGNWVDRFYADGNGNLVFTGNLTGATGNFSGSITANSGSLGGWAIDSTGISDASSGNYIRRNGQIKLGALVINGNDARFTGKFSADQLEGYIGNDKISDVSAGKINQGTMSADRIYGGTIAWPGASMGVTATGAPYISGTGSLSLNANGAGIGIGGGSQTVSIFGPGGASVSGGLKVYNGMTVSGSLSVSGSFNPNSISTGSINGSSLYVSGSVTSSSLSTGSISLGSPNNFNCSGTTGGVIYVGGSFGAKELVFVNGLLQSYSFV
jgi:hypothetical protein